MNLRPTIPQLWRGVGALVGIAGLLMATTPVAADTITYTYDNLGRLASTYDATTGVAVTYTYDLNGNRMVQAVTTGPKVVVFPNGAFLLPVPHG